MSRIRRVKWLVAVALFGLLATACASAEETGEAGGATEATAAENTEDGGPAGGGTAAEGELVDFIWAGPALPERTDPLEPVGLGNIVSVERMSRPVSFDVADLDDNGCTQMASIADIKGELAESWEFSEDGTVLTLKFKEGVMSPFGNELTAEDVKWSYDRGIALSSSIQNFLDNITFWEENDPIKIVDDYTVDIHLAEPGSLDIPIFTSSRWMILDYTEIQKHITDDDPWAEEWLSGNSADFGPWHFTEEDFSAGEQLIMERNPNYHAPEEFGNIGRVVMRVIPEGSTRGQLVAAGEIDYAGQLAPNDYAQLDQAGEAQILNCVAGDRDTLILNQADEHFADVNVRKAVSLAIDRQALSDAAYQGLAMPAVDGMHQGYEFPEPESRITYDPEQARELLAEAGYPDGFAAELTLSPARPGPQAEQIGINVQSQLADIGIDLEINLVASPPEFQTMFLEGQYQAVIYQEPPAVPDPAYTAQLYNKCGGYQNSFGYCNEEYDALQEQILATEPGEERAQLVSDMSSLIVETVPVVYLLDTTLPRAFSAAVDTSSYEHHPYATTLHLHKLVKDAG